MNKTIKTKCRKCKEEIVSTKKNDLCMHCYGKKFKKENSQECLEAWIDAINSEIDNVRKYSDMTIKNLENKRKLLQTFLET